jgi:hypothetical protein
MRQRMMMLNAVRGAAGAGAPGGTGNARAPMQPGRAPTSRSGYRGR